MRRAISTACLALFVLLGEHVTPARAFDVLREECVYGLPSERVKGCTEAIESGFWSDAFLAWAYYERGRAHHARSEWILAVQDYTEALRRSTNRTHSGDFVNPYDIFGRDRPTDDLREPTELAQVHTLRGRAYFEQRRYQSAVEDFSDAIALLAKPVQQHVARGLAYGYLENFPRALKDFDNAIFSTRPTPKLITGKP